MEAWYHGRPYQIVAPQADSEALAEQGERLMFKHDKMDSHLCVAPKGMQTAGWVLGVFIE